MLLISVLEHHLLGIKLTTCEGLFIYNSCDTFQNYKTLDDFIAVSRQVFFIVEYNTTYYY
jgi:hypothetical protein